MHHGIGARPRAHICEAPTAAARAIVSPKHIANRIDHLVIHHIQIQVAIIVIIHPADRKTRPQQSLEAQQTRDIRKAAIAVVMIQRIAAA